MGKAAVVFWGQEPCSKEEVQKMVDQYPELEGLMKSVKQQVGIDLYHAFDSDQITCIDRKKKCTNIPVSL